MTFTEKLNEAIEETEGGKALQIVLKTLLVLVGIISIFVVGETIISGPPSDLTISCAISMIRGLSAFILILILQVVTTYICLLHYSTKNYFLKKELKELKEKIGNKK